MLKKLSKNELILYTIASFIAFIGLIFLLLGIIADNLDINNALNKAQASFPWRYIGLILIFGAIIFALIVLLAYAKRIDRITDRELRRKQRLSAMMSDLDKKEEIVVSEGKIVDNAPSNQEVEKEPEVETKPIDNMNEVK